MNSVNLIGNITKDPEVRYTNSGMAVCQFTIALNRGRNKNGEDLGADFPRVICFDKQAENCGKFLHKGSKVAVIGKLQTGSYENQQGVRVYTTDVVANRVEFLDRKGSNQDGIPSEYYPSNYGGDDVPGGAPAGFETIDDDVPF